MLPPTLTVADVVLRTRSPETATSIKLPVEDVNPRVLPPANCNDPPVIVPPSRFHVPVAAFNVSVSLALLRFPVRLTVPPVRVKEERSNPAVVTDPPRFSVELLTVIDPVELQFTGAMLNVALTALKLPELVNVVVLLVILKFPPVVLNVPELLTVVELAVSVRVEERF